MTAPTAFDQLPSIPSREALFAPYQFEVLRNDPRLTAITDFAGDLCDAPTALVSLVEDHRQIFLARTGFDAAEPPIENSFCAQAMGCDTVMVVLDASTDPRFSNNPLVTAEPGIRFYAGAPLRTVEGAPIGTLCVIDTVPHPDFSNLERHGLETLAQSVMTLFEANRSTIAMQAETSVARDERDNSEQRFKVLADSMPQMVWSTPPDGRVDYYNARWYEYTGVPQGTTDGESWTGVFHPDDQDRAWNRWQESVTSGELYEIEYRIRHHDGSYRWVLGRGVPMLDEGGVITRWFGTCTDIDDQKRAMEQRELISHELSHRIKNIFSVISGLIMVSSRQHPEIKPVADDLRNRVMALGKAHDFVRPHSATSRPAGEQTSLHGMLEELLAAYQSDSRDRIRICGEDPGIDDRSATPMALLFHELATNAAKYGALSSEDGSVELTISCADEKAMFDWRERGGPSVAEPRAAGFGSRLIAMSVEQQLGGTIDRHWHADGLAVSIKVPLSSMRRG
ncbi:PAS domain-containing protein [Sphingomonas sp. RB1R13]|uniref:PAS domain-containing protein n=1 Tax=Sphingomonas sp. RB1R13 TaxID=3096159 RepID=UPI002FC59B9E